jgi:uncharacterized membrane protein
MLMMRGLLPWLAAGVLMGGVLHILAVFALPYVAEHDAWARLSSVLTINELKLDDENPGLVLPFSSPDVVHAYCAFDASERNVLVTSPLLDATWSVAVSTPNAENFYIITGADAKRTNIRLLIIPRDRLAQEESTERTEEGEEQNIVISPTGKGIVAIRAPLRGESFRARTLAELKTAKCEAQQPFEATVASAVTAEQPKSRKPQPPAKPARH